MDWLKVEQVLHCTDPHVVDCTCGGLYMWWTVQEYDIISLIRGLLHTSDLLISLGVIICMVLCVQLTVCKHDRQERRFSSDENFRDQSKFREEYFEPKYIMKFNRGSCIFALEICSLITPFLKYRK